VDTAMVEAAGPVLLLGPPSHTSHSGFGAADGSPGESRGGKLNAERGVVGPADLAASGARFVSPPSNLISLRRF
jgi:hypothetical protein